MDTAVRVMEVIANQNGDQQWHEGFERVLTRPLHACLREAFETEASRVPAVRPMQAYMHSAEEVEREWPRWGEKIGRWSRYSSIVRVAHQRTAIKLQRRSEVAFEQHLSPSRR
jgi:hypothetical protein